MGVPSTFSSRTKTARPLASWPVTTVRTFIPCLFLSDLFMVTFLDSCNFVFILNFPLVLLMARGGEHPAQEKQVARLLLEKIHSRRWLRKWACAAEAQNNPSPSVGAF